MCWSTLSGQEACPGSLLMFLVILCWYCPFPSTYQLQIAPWLRMGLDVHFLSMLWFRLAWTCVGPPCSVPVSVNTCCVSAPFHLKTAKLPSVRKRQHIFASVLVGSLQDTRFVRQGSQINWEMVQVHWRGFSVGEYNDHEKYPEEYRPCGIFNRIQAMEISHEIPFCSKEQFEKLCSAYLCKSYDTILITSIFLPTFYISNGSVRLPSWAYHGCDETPSPKASWGRVHPADPSTSKESII